MKWVIDVRLIYWVDCVIGLVFRVWEIVLIQSTFHIRAMVFSFYSIGTFIWTWGQKKWTDLAQMWFIKAKLSCCFRNWILLLVLFYTSLHGFVIEWIHVKNIIKDWVFVKWTWLISKELHQIFIYTAETKRLTE